MSKVWYKSKTVWCAVGFIVCRGLELAGIIPPGIAESIYVALGAGGAVAIRSAVGTEAQAAKK